MATVASAEKPFILGLLNVVLQEFVSIPLLGRWLGQVSHSEMGLCTPSEICTRSHLAIQNIVLLSISQYQGTTRPDQRSDDRRQRTDDSSYLRELEN